MGTSGPIIVKGRQRGRKEEDLQTLHTSLLIGHHFSVAHLV